MTYTAEQLRGYANSAGSVWYAPILLAFADALEENARLKREMKSLEQALTDPENQPSQFGTVTLEWHEAELAKLRRGLESAMDALGILASMSPKRYDGEQFRKMAAEDYRRIRADFPEEK